MKCNEFQDLLVEFRDGELEEELAASMQLHMGSCHECAAEVKALEGELGLYRRYRESLERDLEADGAMWSGIRGRVSSSSAGAAEPRLHSEGASARQGRPEPRSRHGILRQAAMAAALVLVSVAATLFAVRYFDQQKEREHEISPPPVANDTYRPTGDEKSLEGAMRAIRRAEQDYLDAIRILSEIVDKRKPTLDPGLVVELERNLKSIDESIEATRKAYYAHPSDPDLAQYMLTSYSRKVELLQEITS